MNLASYFIQLDWCWNGETDEDRMLKALAENQGMSISDIIRQFIRRAFAETFPARNRRY
jgi:hypothetical protein